jgi:hypothetical protein
VLIALAFIRARARRAARAARAGGSSYTRGSDRTT